MRRSIPQWLSSIQLLIISSVCLLSHAALSLDNTTHSATPSSIPTTVKKIKTHKAAQLPPAINPTILTKAPHNNDWFTQGLFQDDGDNFYISSGRYNRSTLIYQQPHKITRYSLPSQFFAEGLTVIDDKIFLLTWKENTLFVFDKKTLTPINKLSYKGEGWGLTHNNDSLIMSNGSNTLYFRDKETFEIQRTITVKGLDKINELEYIDGIIWANRWLDDTIYAIDTRNACIVQRIDLSSLRSKSVKPNNKNIANGIAYDKEKNGLWVTGKLWNHRFLIDLPNLNKTHCHID